MAATIRCVTLVGLLLLSAACRESRLTLPRAPTSPPPPLQTYEPPPPPLPPSPLTGPSTTYVFSGPLSYPVGVFTKESKYVLYERGTFVFSYPEGLGRPYVGSYTREDEHLFLGFGSRGATGSLLGDLLEVRYDEFMHHSDFEDAA